MAHAVKCVYCGEIFDRDKEICVEVSPRRYAHATCDKQGTEDLLDNKKDSKKDEETVREKLKKCKHILVPIKSNTNMVKIVYIDIYGNEFMETKILEE